MGEILSHGGTRPGVGLVLTGPRELGRLSTAPAPVDLVGPGGVAGVQVALTVVGPVVARHRRLAPAGRGSLVHLVFVYVLT